MKRNDGRLSSPIADFSPRKSIYFVLNFHQNARVFNTYWVNVNIDFCTFRCKVLFGEIIILRSFFFYIAVHLNENTKLQYIHVRGQCLVHQC